MNILFLSTARYPEGGAEVVRMHNLAKLFQLGGHQVFIAARGLNTNLKENIHDGIRYTSLRKLDGNKIIKIIDSLRYKEYTKELLNNNEFDAIMVMGISTSTLRYIKRYAEKYSKILLHDSVEWYSAEQFKFRNLDITYRKKELWMNKLIDKNFRVIAISKYLEKHFLDQGIKTVRIPVIMDMNCYSTQKYTKSERTTIIYAGSPGKKDFLKEMVDGCAQLEDYELEKLEFRIIGVSQTNLIKICNVSKETINKLGNSLVLIDRVPREVVLKNFEEADFSVLLRPQNSRYAQAGFPTKVVESLASGTPVICNITSDLGDFIRDSENGIVVKDCTASSFCSSIRKALEMTYNDRVKMQNNAREIAIKNFDYRIYVKELNNLYLER